MNAQASTVSGKGSCAHCDLPVGAGGTRRLEKGETIAFCCLGCSIAWRLGGGREGTGGSEAASFLARIGLGFAFTMVVMIIQWVRYVDPAAAAEPSYDQFAPIAQWIACTPVLLILGVPYLWNAFQQLRWLRVGTDLLVGLGILAGYGVSCATVLQGRSEPLFFDTAAGLATLMTVGRWLEASAKHRATSGLRAFLTAARKPARRIEEAGQGETREELVAAERLSVGDLVRVLPGERLPADGVVREGRALLDVAVLTGESLPRAVARGDTVQAPAVPTDGPLVVEVTHAGDDTLLAEVGRVLQQARAERAPYERLADQVARVFVPLVLLLAGLVMASDVSADGLTAEALLHGLSILVVACPCALGIATPLAVSAGLGRLAERGMLVRSGAALAAMPRVRRVAFDKTGTLTVGRPAVEAVEPADGEDADEVLRMAAAAEQGSEHPWGAGILTAAAKRGLVLPRCLEARVHPGRGIEARVGSEGAERTVRVGSAAWLDPEGSTGGIAVEVEGRVVGHLRLGDELRPEAAGAVEALRREGLAVHVLSGDSASAVAGVTERLGLAAEAGMGDLLPPDKVEAVRRLRADAGGALAFVGDGLNDAPALAEADLGIAVGSGTDLAKESAAVSLLGDDLSRLPGLLRAARRVRQAVAWNLLWAFLYNAAAITWAVVYGLPPVLAAVAMILSSLFVIGNSLRLRAALPAVLGGTVPPT